MEEAASADDMKKWVQSKVFIDFERLPKTSDETEPRKFSREEMERDVDIIKAQFTRSL